MKRFMASLLAVTIAFFISPAIRSTAEQTEYESSISLVEALDIMTGYPDGTFRSGENVTRAEFACVITKILNLSPDVSKGELTPYYDVPPSHWASPYVNIANSYGLMNGYGNGYFMPEKSITVSEAQKKYGVKDCDVYRGIEDKGEISYLRPFKKLIKRKPKIKKDLCVACGICVKSCPVPGGAVNFKKKGKPPVYDYSKCIECYCCQEMCPKKAIYAYQHPIAKSVSKLIFKF